MKKKNDEKQICSPDNQCMSGFIGTILALLISVLAWVQKLTYIPSFTKQDCPEFCEFTRTIEKLKEITVQAEAMSKSVPVKKKNEEEDCICIQDEFNQISDDEHDFLQADVQTTKRSESCAKCCQNIQSGTKVLYVEAYPEKSFDQKTTETQTLTAQVIDGTTQRNECVCLGKETQNVKEVKIGVVQVSKVECVCDQTQVSGSCLPEGRKAQDESQLQTILREETLQGYDDDTGGSFTEHKQYKTSVDLKRSRAVSKQSRSSEDEQIAAVYRTLVSEDTYDAECEEEEVNYFDPVCSEQYRPCRQDTLPYYQYQYPNTSPQQVRQPSPYAKREPAVSQQPRPPMYPSYESSYRQAPYECGRDGGGNPIYCYPSQQRNKPAQSYPRPLPVSYSPFPPQRVIHQTTQRAHTPPQYYLPQQYSLRRPTSPYSKRPVRECEPDCPSSKHSVRAKTPPPPGKRSSSPVRECEPECTGSKNSIKKECELECPGSKHSMRGRSPSPRRRSPETRECELECPGSKHAMRRQSPTQEIQNYDESVECIPQCPGYVKKHPRDDCIPECPGYAYRRRRVNPPRQNSKLARPTRGATRECELDCPGSKQSLRSKTPPKSDFGAHTSANEDAYRTQDVDCIPQCPGYRKRHAREEECIPECVRYKEKVRRECLDACPKYDECQGVSRNVQRAPPAKGLPKTTPKKSAGQAQKGRKAAKPSPKQTNAQANPEFAVTGSGRMVAMMPNGAIPINPYSVQEFEAEKPTKRRPPSDSYY